MKSFLWPVVGLAIAGLLVCIAVNTATVSPHLVSQVFIALYALLTVAAALGAFWMLYTAIRYERDPLPYILLAFIPFYWFGYYLDRVRSERLRNRKQLRRFR